MTPFTVRLRFHGDLPFFVRSKREVVERSLKERTSVKDTIEACGVPHTEVDLILANHQPVNLSHVITSKTEIEVFPVTGNAITSFQQNRLQLAHIRTFVADGHLGKLVRDLRLLGIDVLYDRTAEDRQLVETAAGQNRALLTRDRHLLMHSAVRHGYYLRSQNPLRQTVEVLRRFDLAPALAPFSRCLKCNAPLEPAEKQEIIGQLEPLTKIYYHQFRRCPDCGQVYWSGSHFAKLEARIAAIHDELQEEA